MHIHILGICGTFMGGIAMLARQAGFKVTGSDRNVYPPMSDELKQAGIEIISGFEADQLDIKPDLVVVGNVMRRGMGVIERMLDENIPYVSGPQWLEEHYLTNKKVLAVAGTHGKTTTSAMLTWILEYAHLNPGFLIGGIPGNFGISARNTDSPYFVIEADEYDCAFFDKRSKFVHYHPHCLIMNNLEYDHADIFDSIYDIQKQFHHLIRTVPSKGLIVMPSDCQNLDEVISMGLWTPCVRIGKNGTLSAKLLKADGSHFEVWQDDECLAEVNFNCCGIYNVHNALMAIQAALYAGVDVKTAALALGEFKLPKRRLELRGMVNGISVYDDFAHHPTAIALTIAGLKAHLGDKNKIIAVFEPRSNSMKLGANHEQLADAFKDADETFVYDNGLLKWDVNALSAQSAKPLYVISDFDALLDKIIASSSAGSAILVMSNGSFNGIHSKLLNKLSLKLKE